MGMDLGSDNMLKDLGEECFSFKRYKERSECSLKMVCRLQAECGDSSLMSGEFGEVGGGAQFFYLFNPPVFGSCFGAVEGVVWKCHRLQKFELRVSELKRRLESQLCSREAEDYVDSTFREVVTLQLVRRTWRNKSARKIIGPTRKEALLDLVLGNEVDQVDQIGEHLWDSDHCIIRFSLMMEKDKEQSRLKILESVLKYRPKCQRSFLGECLISEHRSQQSVFQCFNYNSHAHARYLRRSIGDAWFPRQRQREEQRERAGRQREQERHRDRVRAERAPAPSPSSFALFLENCAPAVNSLNLGITSPLLLGSANLQLAQIKAQLALQQLNSVASTTVSNSALASLNQALVKISMSMFNARGAFGQSQGPPNQFGQSQGPPNQFGQSQGPPNQFGQSQGPPNQFGQSQGPPNQFGQSQGPPNQFGQSQGPPNQFGQSQGPPSQFGQNQGPPSQFGMNTPGPYMGGGRGMGMGMGPQGASQGNFGGMNMAMMKQPGNNVGLVQWSSYQSPSSGGFRPGYGNTGTPAPPSGDQRSAVQRFHDTMKASNILANFGLSNEDLEELSRYPDEKLTPENMPYILREIRMRKMNKQQPSSSYDQPYKLQDKDYRREVQSSVVDYGHGQQYDYRDRPMESQNMHYSREALREGTWNEDFKRPPQNYPMEPSRDESAHGIKRTVLVVKKGLPKPKLMNDYYGVPALRFPHVCSLCNVECRQMRDWDRHNKTSVHNDSCRLLLKEYPDWDPDAVPPKKEDLAKKEKEPTITEQASVPFSSTRMSPKRLSPRHMSPHRSSPRRLSPRRSSPRRSSPRRASPRRTSPHRSRSSPRRISPHRSRSSPRRTSPHRPRPSPRRSSPHRSKPRRVSPHKPKLSPKHSSPHKPSPRKPSPKRKLQKKLPAKNSNQKPATSQLTDQKPANQKVMKRTLATKKPIAMAKGAAGTAAAAVSVEKPNAQQEANAKLMEEMRRSGRVVHITDLPHDGYTEEDISKLTQPFGKVAGIKLVRSKNEAFLEMAYKEAAVALVEFYSITPVEINHRQVTMMLLGQKKEIPKQLDQKEQSQSQVSSSVQKDLNAPVTSGGAQGASEATPPSADTKVAGGEGTAVEKSQSENVGLNEKGRVIRINNLPARGYKEDDLKRLAKPFGQVLNVVITFSRNQAYLEMACTKAATKMVEFYSLSTIKLKGNAISMQILHQYVDLSDMEVIFKDIIEESGFKPDAGCTIYDHLVHISNLPEDGYTEVDILCVAFRFGRVKDSMFLKPHNKVLLQLESGNAATSMCNFFSEIPHDFHGKTLEFSLSPKAGIQSGNEEKAEKTVEGSSDATTEPEPMETETSGSAESKEAGKTKMSDEKAGKTLSDQTKADSANSTVVVTPATKAETKIVAETTAQNLTTATVSEPPAPLKPSVATASAPSAPLTTKSPAPVTAETGAVMPAKPVPVSNSASATPLGKPAPASGNTPSKPTPAAAGTAAKPALTPAKPAAAITGTTAKTAVNALAKPAPTTSSATPPSVVTKPVTASLAAKPGQAVTSVATKPSQATGSAAAKPTTAGANATAKPAPTPAASKPSQTPAHAASKPTLAAGSVVPKPTAANAASKALPPAAAGVATKSASTTSNKTSSPSTASGATPPVVPTISSPAAEKASLPPATTPPAGVPVVGSAAPAKAEKPATSPTSTAPKSAVPPPATTNTTPPKPVGGKPGSKESSASKSNEKKTVHAKKEHLAKELSKPSLVARGRSTSRDRSSKEGSGRSTSLHQKEKESRPDRRHMSQHPRDKDHKSSTRSKTTSERSIKDRKTSSKSPKKEAEKDIFPFNLDEFVTVDEVGEEEDTSGHQIPENESKTNAQLSERAEPEKTKAETMQEVKEPEPAPAPGDAPIKVVETTEVTSQPESGPQSEPLPRPQSEPLPRPQSEPLPRPQTEPLPRPQTEPLPRPQTEPLPRPQTEPLPRPQTEPLPLPRPQTEPLPRPQTEPLPRPQTESQPQPHTKAAVKEEPMETESETAQEQSPEAPTSEASQVPPVTDSKQEAAETTAVKEETVPSLGGDGEPSRKTAGYPSSLSPAPASSVSSGGDGSKPTSVEQRADAKLRREPSSEVEPEAKRTKLAGQSLTELKMPPYKPNNPIGVEFIVPKTGYFCQICSLFYTNEETAKVTHCGTVLHYKNMEKYVTQRKEELRKQQERMAKQGK
ncbi:zinc finger protein 638-like [Heterodontus francisci]|uniref:zinc finger protein 638-like n=1 Tax=Heterodontus francisci TaxID=7792 RepID=UPI00355B62C3